MHTLTMLGTGSALVTECYNTCFALTMPDGQIFLTDAGGGNGILRQMKRARLDWARCHFMFATHGHTDHVVGAVWVVRQIATLMNQGRYDGDFHLYGHDVVINIIDTMSRLMLKKKDLALLGQRIHLHEIRDGESVEFLGLTLTAFDIASTKAKQFGYRLLMPALTLTCLGDEPYNERTRAYAENADWLLSEAFCRYADRDTFKPYEKNHSTVKEAAEIAQSLRARHLLLYHTEDTTLATRKAAYADEARQFYDGDVRVPDDLDVLALD